MMNINERENDSQNRYVRISILDNDVCMIMKQYENYEVSKCQNEINPLVAAWCEYSFYCLFYFRRMLIEEDLLRVDLWGVLSLLPATCSVNCLN